jgi:hypothetical protein
MHSLYKEVMGEKVVNHRNYTVTKSDLQELPRELYGEFMPRSPKTANDIWETTGVIKGLRDTISMKLRDHLSNYIVNSFYGNSTKGIPLRFYASEGSSLITGESFSYDADKSYQLFMRNLYWKKYMDGAAVMGQGLVQYLDQKTDTQGNSRYPEFTKFLEQHVLMQILRNNTKGKYLSDKGIIVTPSMAQSWYGKFLRLKPGTKIFNI